MTHSSHPLSDSGSPPTILAVETSCDETAVAILRGPGGEILASEIASQIDLHRLYGGIVPEVASRNHLVMMEPVLKKALAQAGVVLGDIDAFAATTGPGLASSLLIGTAAAKGLAIAEGKPFLAVNHLEGHLLSPFLGQPDGIRPCVALIVSGGHTLLAHVRGFRSVEIHGRTLDDAAGEAFDKVAKMLDLPYPGGPEIEKQARRGDPVAYPFPRSMLRRDNFDFSFSGLKTAVLYTLEKLPAPRDAAVPDLCAAFQEAVVEVLVKKTVRLAQSTGENLITLSGGVSCNGRLRTAMAEACHREGRHFLPAAPSLTTDNAAMIAYVALAMHAHGITSALDTEVDPNLPLATS